MESQSYAKMGGAGSKVVNTANDTSLPCISTRIHLSAIENPNHNLPVTHLYKMLLFPKSFFQSIIDPHLAECTKSLG